MKYKLGLLISLGILVASIIIDVLYSLPLFVDLFIVLFVFPLTLMMIGYAYMSPRKEEEEEIPFIGY
jgi:hypothetical protein